MATEMIHGDTFDYVITMPNSFSDGFFVPYAVYAQVRTAKYSEFVADLECTWVDAATTRDLKLFKIATKDWPLVNCEVDLKFIRRSDNYVFSSHKESLIFLKNVTDVDVEL